MQTSAAGCPPTESATARPGSSVRKRTCEFSKGGRRQPKMLNFKLVIRAEKATEVRFSMHTFMHEIRKHSKPDLLIVQKCRLINAKMREKLQ